MASVVRDLNQAQVIANFVSGEWEAQFAFAAALHSRRERYVGSVEFPNATLVKRLRRELQSDLKELLNGQALDRIVAKINKVTNRSHDLHICKAGTKAGEPNKIIEHTGRITLGETQWSVGYTVRSDYTIHELFYTLLREAIEAGTIERIRFCRRESCKKVFYQKSKLGEYCSGPCRWGNRDAKNERS